MASSTPHLYWVTHFFFLALWTKSDYFINNELNDHSRLRGLCFPQIDTKFSAKWQRLPLPKIATNLWIFKSNLTQGTHYEMTMHSVALLTAQVTATVSWNFFPYACLLKPTLRREATSDWYDNGNITVRVCFASFV